MKNLLCRAIMNAPQPIISTDDPDWFIAQQLQYEAERTRELLWTLMYHYNSAVHPQSKVYDRVKKLHNRSIQRYRRRSIICDIAMYRSMGYTPDRVRTDHVHYHEIIAGLSK